MIVKVLVAIAVLLVGVVAGLAAAFAMWRWGGASTALAIITGASVFLAFSGATFGLVSFLGSSCRSR